MEIKYRSLAVDRMLERNISTMEVELVISEPDGTIKQSEDKFIFYKHIKGRKDNHIAAVTILKSRNTIEVLTVMIDFEVPQ
jgi:hypothetical protein